MLCGFNTVHVAKTTCVANADAPSGNVLTVVDILSELKVSSTQEALIEEIWLVVGDHQLRCLMRRPGRKAHASID